MILLLGFDIAVLINCVSASTVSPCQCAQREGQDHALAVVSGVSLAMLIKLSTLDRDATSLSHVADACADAAHRAVVVSERRDDGDGEGAGRSG